MSAITPILKAIRIALDAPTDENIFALADAAGLTIKKEVPNKIEVVEHTTKKGKVIRGVVRTDLSYSEAKAIDEYTFKKDGGWFIREKHLGIELPTNGNQKQPTDTPKNEPVAVVESDTLVNDADNNIEGLTRKFKPAAKKYKNPEIRLEPKEGAKLLKKTLTKLFPDTKFSVTMSRGTAYGSVNVSWVDGASYDLVDVIARHFKGSGFDGMSDSSYSLYALNEDGKVIDYGLGYVSISRGYSREFLEKLQSSFSDMLQNMIKQEGVTIKGDGFNAYFDAKEHWTRDGINKAKSSHSTGKYHYGAIPQAVNDEPIVNDGEDSLYTNLQPPEFVSIEQQRERQKQERLANAQARINELPVGVKRALAHSIYKEEMEKQGKNTDSSYPAMLKPNDVSDMVAYYKAKARKERRYKDIDIFDYSISKDYKLDKHALKQLAIAGLYEDHYLDKNTLVPQDNQPSLMQDAKGLDPTLKDMVKEYYDLKNNTYIDQKLADPTLENWERKEYLAVKADYDKRRDELEQHLNNVVSANGIDWESYYNELSKAKVTPSVTSVELEQPNKEILKKQALKLDDVLVEWKPRFRWSAPPAYQRLDAKMLDKVFHVRGDISMLRMTASISINGQEPPKYAVEHLKKVEAAKKAGYEMQRVQIKSDTGVIFVKNGMVLTNDGADKLLSVDSSIYDKPEIPNKAGYVPIIAAKVNIAKSFVKWLQTYGDSDDLATITKRLKETGFFDKFKIVRADNDSSSLELRYREDVKTAPAGGAAYTAKISKRGDWLDLKKYIYQLAGVNLADYDDNGDSKIKGQKGLWFVINDFNEGENNVPSTSRALESDSDKTIGTNQKQSAENGNANESGELGRLARPPVNGLDARGGSERDSGLSLPKNDGIGIGARGDTIVSDGAGQRGTGASNTTTSSSRSSGANEPRTPVVRERDRAVVRTATTTGSVTQTAKEAEQLKAEGTPTQWGDAQNIEKALPYLLPEQRDDVAKLEKRLIEENKNGMLFTNGTGTGKTFTGLGAVKRFANAGKKNILIVSMNDKIIRDFIKSAKSLNLDVHQLDGITDNGKDKIVATTYANMAQNNTLGMRDWDLIIVDEAHNLMQGEKGENTNALAKLRALSGHHAGFNEWVKMRHADKDPKPVGENPETGNPIYNQDEVTEWEQFKKPLREQWKKTWSEQPKGRTKVVFLTATPFSYVKTLDWAEGYLFDFVPPADKFSNKTDAIGSAYNSGDPVQRFYMSNFGYKMRNNRLTRPDARVDVGILERKFAEKLKTEGAMSGRELSVPFDYDRKFVLVNSKIGEKIDEGFDYLWNAKDKDDKQKYGDLLRVINKRFDYLARLQLLEAIKAEEAIDQIKKHLALGRKVIVFHDFNEGGTTNPFVVKGGLSADDATSVESQYSEFKKERPDLINLELDIPAPIVTLRKAFPNALLFNGRVAKGQRIKNADLFNSDDSGNNVLIAQSDAGATGISFHDTTGKFQRVIINIGMPTKPAKLRQTEGRIYRVGQASNAIQRYLTTGTNWERSAFAQKIAERAETVDNLSQGESAVVSIKDALVQAYEEAEYFEPSENDGIGGKAYDEENARINKLTPFERAKSDYWVKQKVTAKRSEREGKEWYATPEPVGLFMVNLSGAHSGDDVLEPSAGDGAIGRYMPSDASVTFIEPTDSLASRARMNNTNANVIVDNFESHESINKYDAIVMNPPFGNGGSIAIKHLVKAFEHLRDGGRVVALLPVGKMDELIADYQFKGYFRGIYKVAEFTLPSSTFENAGTRVNTKIYVFERHEDKADAPQDVIVKNLSHYDDINQLFDAIENINIKPRKPRLDEALAEYGIEIYPERNKYIVTGEGINRKDIVAILFGAFPEKNSDGDYVEKYNRGSAFLRRLKEAKIPTMAQFNQGLSANNLPIKYQQPNAKHNTWDGVGDMPDWLRGLLRYGGKLESFAVEKPVYDAVEDLSAEKSKAKMIIESIPKTLEKLRLLDETPQVLEVIKLYEKNLNDLIVSQTKEDYQKAFDVRQIATKESNALIGGKSAAFFEELRAKKALKSEVVEPKKTTNETLVALIGIALNEPSVSNLQKMATAAGLGLIVKKEKKLSKEQIDKYLEIAFSDDIVRADNWLVKELKAIGFDDDSRFNALHKAHNYFAQEKKNRELQAKKDAAKARKIANADNAKIKTIVDALLQKGRLLRGREYEFLVSIQNKRVLSVKQRDWLELIADRLGVPIKGNVVIKASQRTSNYSYEDFEDYITDIYGYELSPNEMAQEYQLWKNRLDDIDGFNFAPSIDLDQTLKALKVALADSSYDNIKRLATLAGLTLLQPTPDIDLDIFGEPINQGFDLFGDPIQDNEESPVEELPRLAVVELPLNKLTLSEDVPQFKSGADDDTGVVEALGGKFDRTGVAPIQVWERLDGRLEIISGRHRTDLARRSGEKTIPAQVHKESEGFSAKQAMMLDAELNIRDGQGKVKDYVDYFTHSEISEEEADRRGLISRAIGQRAFAIASKGSEELITLHRNEIISDQAAADIANIAPNNSAMQAVGLRVLQEHKPLNNALNTIRAVQALTREKGQEPDAFDLFGFDDSALKEAEAMARIASRKQRLIAEQLTAIKGAVKNPKLAAKHGVVVENEADALAKVKAMTAEKARWDNWSSYADLLAEVRRELNDKLDAVFDDDDDDEYYWLCHEELAA